LQNNFNPLVLNNDIKNVILVIKKIDVESINSFEIIKDLQNIKHIKHKHKQNIKHFRNHHILLNQLKQNNANSANQWILVINFSANNIIV